MKGQKLDRIVDIEKKGFNVSRITAPTVNDNFNIVYCRMEWEVDPGINFIQGKITSYFSLFSSFNDTLKFDLKDNMIVDSVIHQLQLLSFSHFGDVLRIASSTFQSTLDSISIYYHGSPQPSGNGSFVQSYHNGIPIIWTLSEPYGACDWWPCKQFTDDKIDSADVMLTYPAAYKGASNGVLVSETTSGSNRIAEWKSKYPIAPYLVAIAVTDYAVILDSVLQSNADLVPIVNYVYPEDSLSAAVNLPEIKTILHFYDSLITPYPFSKEKYGHAQFGWGGGMEHQTMSFMAGFDQELMAHESAHQWFGDKITCASWKDIWLNEGFATYFAAIYGEYYYPQNWHSWKASVISNVTVEKGGSVECNDTTDVARIFDGRLSYRKASYLLHMLRSWLGDSVFFSGLKNYLNDPLLCYGFATTDDLRRSLELSSGKDLRPFFKEWYEGSGYPSYRVEWRSTETEVSFELYQTTSDTSVPFYHLPIPLDFVGESRDTIIRVDASYSGQSFIYSLPFRVKNIEVDPELDVLSSLNKVISKDEINGSVIRVYPNPFIDVLHILSTHSDVIPIEIRICDFLGKAIFIKKLGGVRLENIELPDLSNGIYIIKIFTPKGVFPIKMQKIALTH